MTSISSRDWNQLFPCRLLDYYSHENFTAAVRQMGFSFSNKRELAAFLANIAHESVGLSKIVEENPQDSYTGGKRFLGRGPIQLTHNYNYAAFSDAYFGDQNVLLDDPDRLSRNGKLGFAAAIWFWNSSGNPTCHDYMQVGGNWGFGYTIRRINGGEPKDESQSRINYYKKFARFFDVEVGVHGERLYP